MFALSENLWFSSQKDCVSFALKKKSSKFLITSFDVNHIPMPAFCIDRNK